MKTYNLEIKWTISKGENTYGYNICSLWDYNKKYSTCGGGYDMLGTVFAQWLFANYKDKIIEKCQPARSVKESGCFSGCEGYYGFFNRGGGYYLDGACGFSSIEAIAKAIGLDIQKIYGRKNLKFIIISDKELN